MNKNAILLFPVLLLLCSCAARIETSSLVVRWDQPQVEQAAQKIADKLRLTPAEAPDSITFLISSDREIPLYSCRAMLVASPSDSFRQLALSTACVSRAVAANLNKCITSFYLQELEPGYTDKNRERLASLPPKSLSAMRKRAWVNLGYGLRYAGQGNPFVSPGDNLFWSVALGLWDVAHYGLIIGGPFIGKTDADKVRLSAGGAISLLAWKLFLTNMEMKKTVLGYNTLTGAGYAVPREVLE
jgi:hypothetical protein